MFAVSFKNMSHTIKIKVMLESLCLKKLSQYEKCLFLHGKQICEPEGKNLFLSTLLKKFALFTICKIFRLSLQLHLFQSIHRCGYQYLHREIYRDMYTCVCTCTPFSKIKFIKYFHYRKLVNTDQCVNFLFFIKYEKTCLQCNIL